MDLGLRGRAAAITASSKGLGRAAAEALAREGCDVAICARGEDALRATGSHLEELGVRVLARVLDVGAPGACESFVEEAAATFGRLDVVVGNNGGPRAARFDEISEEELREILDRNLVLMARIARAALPHMRARGWGRILFVSSISAKSPIDGLIAGNTARAGILGLTKTLAREVARDGITVNALAPDAILTDRIRALAGPAADDPAAWQHVPMGRAGTPQEFGALVAFLAGEPASYVSGTTISVDGAASRSIL